LHAVCFGCGATRVHPLVHPFVPLDIVVRLEQPRIVLGLDNLGQTRRSRSRRLIGCGEEVLFSEMSASSFKVGVDTYILEMFDS
jgi:hypothetical protein